MKTLERSIFKFKYSLRTYCTCTVYPYPILIRHISVNAWCIFTVEFEFKEDQPRKITA